MSCRTTYSLDAQQTETIHKIRETNSSFHMKQHTTGKV